VEYEPLIVDSERADPSQIQMGTDEQFLRPEGRAGDKVARIAAFAAASVFLVTTWAIVLTNQPTKLGWFFWHPILQSFSITIFSYGIMTLQPTAQVATKAAGLSRHQLAMFAIGFPAIFLGTLAMWWNKVIHNAPHAVTWHGLFGYIAITWIVAQVLVGGGSVWFDGRLFGGNPRAKLVWKYHRLSGYVLFPLLLLTAHFGGGWSDWTNENSAYILRLLGYTVAPLVLLIAVLVRVRLSKMKIF